MFSIPNHLMWHQRQWLEASDKHRVMVCKHPRRAGMTLADASISAKQVRQGIEQLYVGHYCAEYSAILELFGFDLLGSSSFYRKHSFKFINAFNYDCLDELKFILQSTQKCSVILDAIFFYQSGDKLSTLIKELIDNPVVKNIRIFSSLWEQPNIFDDLCTPKYWQKLDIPDYYYQEHDFRTIVKHGFYKKVCEESKELWTQEKEDQWVANLYKDFGDSAKYELDLLRN